MLYSSYVCIISLSVVSIYVSLKSSLTVFDFYVVVSSFYFSSYNSSLDSSIRDFALNKSMYPERIFPVSPLHLAAKLDKIAPDSLL